MKIGILSDTHDQAQRTRIAISLLKARGAELLIHCGDITTAEVVYEFDSLPTYFVFGNCDDDTRSLKQVMEIIGATCLGRSGLLTLDGRKIAITHGDSEQELSRMRSSSPDFLLSGHTHRMIDERHGSIRRINPGALHRAPFWSVAILDLNTDKLEVLLIEREGSTD